MRRRERGDRRRETGVGSLETEITVTLSVPKGESGDGSREIADRKFAFLMGKFVVSR